MQTIYKIWIFLYGLIAIGLILDFLTPVAEWIPPIFTGIALIGFVTILIVLVVNKLRKFNRFVEAVKKERDQQMAWSMEGNSDDWDVAQLQNWHDSFYQTLDKLLKTLEDK